MVGFQVIIRDRIHTKLFWGVPVGSFWQGFRYRGSILKCLEAPRLLHGMPQRGDVTAPTVKHPYDKTHRVIGSIWGPC